jgi:tetratricopeptide (TPR) repeat protein
MSREYAIQGQHRQAVKAMESALVLAAENRFVLRAACALFVYSGEPDRAMRAIHRSNSTKKDPWLMAAEIASSEAAHRPPKSIKAGLRLLESRTVAPFQFAELAGALATEELNSGAARSAKKLFRTALIDPNENTVAQVEWAAESIKGLPLEPRHFLLPHSFESKAREMRSQGKWREALAQTRRWLFDQPFSAAPALLGSYIAVAALSDHKEAARLARAGLVANPHNDLLKNNLAVALAVAGDVAEATRILSTIDHETNNRALRATFLATNGLISYRLGAIDQGRLLYGRAIELLGAPGLQRMRANAALYRAREELLAGQDHALEFARAAKKLSEISEPLETGVLLSTVEALAASKGVVM